MLLFSEQKKSYSSERYFCHCTSTAAIAASLALNLNRGNKLHSHTSHPSINHDKMNAKLVVLFRNQLIDDSTEHVCTYLFIEVIKIIKNKTLAMEVIV
jgi:hypothetical protein